MPTASKVSKASDVKHPSRTSAAADASSIEKSALDWPREAGLADEFLAKVDSRLRRRKQRRRTAVGVSTLVLAALLVGLWGVPYYRDTGAAGTPAAHRETLALADGSQAELNAQTSVRTDFRYGRRIVRLDQGEAFFSVAKDASHPFLVETPAGTVRVTGTKFNVRMTAPDRTEVTLLEGAVQVQESATDPVKLTPGQQFDSAGANVRTLTSTELERVVAWRKGELALDGLTLREAMSRLAAFHGIRIDVVPEVAGLRPGGTFPVDDLKGFLGAVETALPVRVMPQGDGSFRIVGR